MNTIFSFIQEQESLYKQPIPLEEGWYWGMKDHIRRSFLYKHSQFEQNNEDRETRPFKNIVRPILNVQYRTEGFDVKDIEIYVDNPDTYYKSFLIKKYHDKWALTNAIDTFIDELVESFVDYGGVLVKNVKGVRPEVVDLRTVSFCDQTDFLSGPFAIKHFYSPSQLKDMESVGWGKTGATITIDDLILKAENSKNQNNDNGETKTPGKYLEIYEVHNVSERDFDITSVDSDPQIIICGFYNDDNGNPHGVTLFKNKEPKLPFKFLKRDPIQGRALGWGGIEELFEPQMWTNFAEITIAGMLEHASKVYYVTTDPKFKGQIITDRDNGSILDLQPNGEFRQVDNQPRNMTMFENYQVKMHEHAMEIGSASDLALSKEPASGTPFKSVELQVAESNSLHLWRQGRIATFLDEIYRDWIIPQLGKELTKGTKFLSELSSDEMISVSEALMTSVANDKMKKALITGENISRQQYDEVRAVVGETFNKSGNKKFLELLKDEMTGEKLSVSTNIAGKQKDLAKMTDKLVNTIRQFIASPEIRQDPDMRQMLNAVLESSGLSPLKYNPVRQQPNMQDMAKQTQLAPQM